MSYDIYKVGGVVRDSVLGVSPRDIDMVAVGVSQEELDDRNIWLPERSDRYNCYYNKGFKKVFAIAESGQTIEEHLGSFDFTMNALAIKRGTEDIIDPYGGVRDLNQKIIKMINPAVFENDNRAILRLFRLKHKLKLNFDKDTYEEVKNYQKFNDTLDFFRVKIEINKMLESKGVLPSEYFIDLINADLLFYIMPWMKIGPNNLKRFLFELDNSKDKVNFYWRRFNISHENINTYYRLLDSKM